MVDLDQVATTTEVIEIIIEDLKEEIIEDRIWNIEVRIKIKVMSS
jgi:hypothetical protein